MAIGAQNAAAVSIVQEHKVADHFMLVGSHLLAKDAQGADRRFRGDISQYLVVGPVLFDDVDDMVEHAWLSHAFGHGLRRDIGARRQAGFGDQRITKIVQGGLRVSLQFVFKILSSGGTGIRDNVPQY